MFMRVGFMLWAKGLRSWCNLESVTSSFIYINLVYSAQFVVWLWWEVIGGLNHHTATIKMMIEIKIYWLPLALLQRHIYGLKGRNIDVFADNSSLAINPHYIWSWLDLLSRTPRVAPFLQKNDPFIAALKKVCMVAFNDFISFTWFLFFWQEMTLVFWCRNCPNTLLMCMSKVMRLMACSLSMMQRKQL